MVQQKIKRNEGTEMENFHVITSTPDKKELPTMLTIKELAQKTNLSYNHIRQLCLKNEIVYIKAGSKYLINLDKFIEYLNKGTK